MAPSNHVWIVLLIFCMMVCDKMSSTRASNSMSDSHSVNRLNYGVYFDFTQTFYPITDNWIQTFKLTLPDMRFDSLVELERELLSRRALLTPCDVAFYRPNQSNIALRENTSIPPVMHTNTHSQIF